MRTADNQLNVPQNLYILTPVAFLDVAPQFVETLDGKASRRLDMSLDPRRGWSRCTGARDRVARVARDRAARDRADRVDRERPRRTFGGQ